eukprot:14974946-Heterocapsa_arctica.AAC.1
MGHAHETSAGCRACERVVQTTPLCTTEYRPAAILRPVSRKVESSRRSWPLNFSTSSVVKW